MIRAQGLLVCPRKSHAFPGRPNSSCTRSLLSQEMHCLHKNPNVSRAGDATLQQGPSTGLQGTWLFSSLAIAVSCPLGPPEICLLDTVLVYSCSPFLIHFVHSLSQTWLMIFPYSLKPCPQPAAIVITGPGGRSLHSDLFLSTSSL